MREAGAENGIVGAAAFAEAISLSMGERVAGLRRVRVDAAR
jgi:hypothetical protein